MSSINYPRFPTRIVTIGDIPLGGNYPVRVQSMTNTDTLDTLATADQVERLVSAGCEYVRIAVPGIKDAANLRNIKGILSQRGIRVPLIADVHFNAKIAEIAASIVEKVRINPGNYYPSETDHLSGEWNDEEYINAVAHRIKPLLTICKGHGTALRIGVNHGSLSERILKKFGDTPQGMVESAIEFARICEVQGFNDLVLSMKSSNTRVMIAANRLLVQRMKEEGMNYPMHLGVTEAGAGEDGRIKSSVGIGSLLADGIGDTIRVSLTENPEQEIPVAYSILQATGTRITKTEYIACPSCSRTLFDIQKTLATIQSRTSHLKGLKIAVMGCVVNGPGEMADAHYGYVGAARGKISLYKGHTIIRRNIDESDAVDELISLIKEQGDWINP